MTLNKKNTWGGVSYETPLVTTLDVLSEGVLCASGDTWTLGGAGTYTDEFINENGDY
jgi:hypothetical protein